MCIHTMSIDPPPKLACLKTFTMSEVRKHGIMDDAWLVNKGIVWPGHLKWHCSGVCISCSPLVLGKLFS